MKIYLEKENKHLNLNFKGSVKELLEKVNINIETVVVLKNNEIVNEEGLLEEKDDIKILSVISGG